MVPMAYCPTGYFPVGECGSSQSLRSMIWFWTHGSLLPSGHVIRMRCQNPRCVAQAHMVLMTRSQHVAEQGRRGELSTPARCAARAKWARENNSRLTVEAVREIRSSPETNVELAQRFGVNKTTISQIRCGNRWRESANGSSVFAWRPAA